MRSFALLAVALFFGLNVFSQSRVTVKLKLTYRGNPLCYWDVTIKHGDATIGKGKSDEKGEVTFSSVQLLSRGIDAYGYKKTSNGEKKWDVKGYIGLDDNNSADVDFEKLIDQMGAPKSMMEAAWGLTLNDCNQKGSASNEGSSNNSSSNNSGINNGGTNSSVTDEPKEKTMEEKMADMKREREENQANSAEQRAQQKQALEQKVQRLNKKVEDARTEQAKYTPGTSQHSDASYELRDLEIDRDLAQMKLEKMNDQDANNTGMLSKSERQRYNDKVDALEAEQKELRKNKKDGLAYGQKPGDKNEPSGDKKDDKKEDEDEDESSLKIYTEAEIANMSTFDLKKTRVSNNNSINKRKVKLKAKAAFLDQDKKAKIQSEIDALEKQIESIKVILASRNEKEDTKEEGKEGEKKE
ncbi:MAG TPA: hypothetical protein VK177_03160 [Flavobacteriales bacterium]|nr:hypothetical protein [Flavobacteriales bacterium]